MKISYQLIKEYRHFFTLFRYLKAPEGLCTLQHRTAHDVFTGPETAKYVHRNTSKKYFNNLGSNGHF